MLCFCQISFMEHANDTSIKMYKLLHAYAAIYVVKSLKGVSDRFSGDKADSKPKTRYKTNVKRTVVKDWTHQSISQSAN